MIDLERALVELAERVELADAEWLADEVLHRVTDVGVARPPRRLHLGVRIAAAACVVPLVLVAALPGARHAVARWLGFDSVSIEPGATASSTTRPSPSTTTGASPSTTGVTPTTVFTPPALDLGPAMSIGEAMAATGLPDPTPQLLGPAQSVHVVRPPSSGQIMLVYAPSGVTPQSNVSGVGALVSVMPARLDEGMFRKMLGDTATVQAVDVAGDHGFWIEGAPHQLIFEFNDRSVDGDTLRLATNTLLWQRGDVVYRLEADISLSTALLIAQSV